MAKEKLEDLIQRGEVLGLLSQAALLIGWRAEPGLDACGVALGGVGAWGQQPFSFAGKSRAGAQGQQRKLVGVSLNFRWLLSHSPLSLGVSFARSLPLRSLFQSLE